MLRKSIKFILVLMALILLLTPAWGSIPDATDAEDQALTFFRNHEVAESCVWVEFLENQPVLARGGGSGGGSGSGSNSGISGTSGTSGGFGNNNGPHGKGSQGINAAQQNKHENKHENQYQQRKTTEIQNQHQHQYQQKEGSEIQNQHQYQQREASETQN